MGSGEGALGGAACGANYLVPSSIALASGGVACGTNYSVPSSIISMSSSSPADRAARRTDAAAASSSDPNPRLSTRLIAVCGLEGGEGG